MASQGYYDWLDAGRPYALIRPARALQAALRGHGLTVFDFPNDEHLRATPPEDHTPFSATGFPGPNKRWHARALDIMPRDGSAAALRENADIARQLIRDRDAGLPAVMWIKYINWTAEDGTCRQERWTNAGAPLQRTTRTSGDDGHVHVSGRSDVDDDGRAESYDPIARMGTGGGEVDQKEILQFGPKAGAATVGDALSRGWKNTEDLADGKTAAHRELLAQLAAVGADARAGRIAVEALAAAVNAGGGSVDAAAIVAHMDELAAAEVARELELLARIADLEAELTAARAEVQATMSPAERASVPPA